jgi:hypothetical protein
MFLLHTHYEDPQTPNTKPVTALGPEEQCAAELDKFIDTLIKLIQSGFGGLVF